MDDLISRKEAINALNRLCLYPGEWAVNGLDFCKDAIANLPSIDAVPVRKGRWIDGWRGRLDGTRYWYRACSECDYERDDDDAEKDTNFCPNCGARMEREDG